MTYTDKQLLDFLESQSNGELWIARHSLTGRGFRLHNTTRGESDELFPNMVRPTAREAIAAAMEKAESK